MQPKLGSGLAVIVVACLSGCGDCGLLQESQGDGEGNAAAGPPETAADPPQTAAGPPQTECGSASFPCSWNDVSKEVLARTDSIADDALAVAVSTRSAAAIAKAIAAHDGGIVLGTSPGAVRFRVEGGRPAWVFVGGDEGMTKGGGPVPLPLPWAGPTSADGDADTPPIGPQRHGEKPTKKALVLSPFLWQWELGGTRNADRTNEVEAIFLSIDDYENGVTRIVNRAPNDVIERNVGFTQFGTLGEYDAVHVSTHGGVACDDGDCITALATGDLWPDFEDSEVEAAWLERFRAAGIEIGYMPLVDVEAARQLGLTPIRRGEADAEVGDHSSGTAFKLGPVVLLTSEYFARIYPGGLDDKIIFFDACHGGEHGDLASTLEGENTAVLGWKGTIYSDPASLVSTCFWKVLLGRTQERPRTGHDDCPTATREVRKGGTNVEDAYERVKAAFRETNVTMGPPMSIVAEGDEGDAAPSEPPVIETVGNVETRGREIIRLVDEDGDLLRDRGSVEIIGAPGDGKPDKLEVTAELMGLRDDDNPRSFRIQLSVDDREVPTTWTATEPVEPGVFRGTKVLDLGFDLPAGRRFNLDPWVTYPEGLSRWHYDDVAGEYFVFTISGPAFATPQTFIVPGDHMNPDWFAAGGLKLGYSGGRGSPAVSEDGSVLKHWLGSQTLPENVTPGEYPFGEGASGRYAFTVIIIPQNRPCPGGAQRCPRRTLSTELGTIELTEYRLGKSVSRRDATGPNIAAGTFEMPVRAAKPWEGERYQIEGALFLID